MKIALDILAYLTVAAILAVTFGCAVTQTTDQPYYNYRAEMVLNMNGKAYKGLAITKIAGPLAIQITSPITLNRVELSTCSRHEVIRNIDKGWFDKVSNVMVYNYQPTAYELEGHCPLLIQAFNDQVQKAWGMVFFQSDQFLQAHVDCNGEGWTTLSGITVCQTKAGLEQQLSFAKPVKFEATPQCTIQSTDQKNFQVRSSVGWCKATFSDGVNFHDLVQLGYNQVINY